MAKEKENLKGQMEKIGREFGKEKGEIASAITAALKAQDEFESIVDKEVRKYSRPLRRIMKQW